MRYLNEKAGIGPCMDVKAHNGLLYVIQRENHSHRGRLYVLRPDLTVISLYEGIGNARQIEIVGNTAVITARENGIWIFDIAETTPKLFCRYQTVEYATGVSLYGNLAFISCRQYGVQILDISDPSSPVHIGLIRVGEVQSATVCDSILYCGVWGKMKVVVVDIQDVSRPMILSEIDLQGRGDGLCVKDNILYAATGQHARGIFNINDPDDPAYGNGNGVECFDVSNPSNPVRLGGMLFERAYCVSVDMWEVAIYGDTLIVNDSVLGVYGLEPKSLKTKFRLLPPAVEPLDAVTGVTSIGADLFVATCYGDLFAARGMDIGMQEPNRTDVTVKALPHPFEYDGYGADIEIVYRGDFPVLAIAETDAAIALACSEGGVHLLDKNTCELCSVIPTLDYAQDVKFCKGKLYVAEGSGGVEIFELSDFAVKKLGGFAADKSIYQLSVSNSGRYIMCALATNEIRIYDAIDLSQIKELYSYKAKLGLLYGNNFASNHLADGTMVLFWHRDGLIFTNPEQGDDRFFQVEYTKKRGFCGYCVSEGIETDGENIIYTTNGGYTVLSKTHEDKYLIDELPCYRAGEEFNGLLTIRGDRMITVKRASGEIHVIDVKDLRNPKIIAAVSTTASPSKAVFAGEQVLLPGGRSGLLTLKLNE